MKFAHANNFLWTQGPEEPGKAERITSRKAFQIVVFVGCAVKARFLYDFVGTSFCVQFLYEFRVRFP